MTQTVLQTFVCAEYEKSLSLAINTEVRT